MKAIQVKYLPCTNHKGTRIKAWAEGGNSVTIGYPHELSGEAVFKEAALKLCEKMNWSNNIIGGGLPNGDYCFVFAGYIIEALQNITEQVVEDVPHETRGKHFQAALDEAFSAIETAIN